MMSLSSIRVKKMKFELLISDAFDVVTIFFKENLWRQQNLTIILL